MNRLMVKINKEKANPIFNNDSLNKFFLHNSHFPLNKIQGLINSEIISFQLLMMKMSSVQINCSYNYIFWKTFYGENFVACTCFLATET